MFALALLGQILEQRDLNGQTNESKRGDTLSKLFVDAYSDPKEKPCRANEVIMSSSSYRDLQKQNK